MLKQQLIKSPLNYTGNKYRILPQILPYFPKDAKVVVDLFCGGATVGLNVDCEKVIFVDNNPKVIGLLQFFAKAIFENLIAELITLAEQYNLSCSYINTYKIYKDTLNDKNTNNGLKEFNSKGFYDLRKDYNALDDKTTDYAYKMLYLLMLYGFNNDIRFSKEGNYNLPIGKTDLNAINVKKLKDFMIKLQSIDAEFICSDFNSPQVQQILQIADFVYLDPPYLITTAVYNETNKWNENKEYELLELIEKLCNDEKRFILSNVLTKNIKGVVKRNEPLYYWTKKIMADRLKIVDIDYHYRSASYNKKHRDALEREVIIMPKGMKG